MGRYRTRVDIELILDSAEVVTPTPRDIARPILEAEVRRGTTER
jgi:hypothetical protein